MTHWHAGDDVCSSLSALKWRSSGWRASLNSLDPYSFMALQKHWNICALFPGVFLLSLLQNHSLKLQLVGCWVRQRSKGNALAWGRRTWCPHWDNLNCRAWFSQCLAGRAELTLNNSCSHQNTIRVSSSGRSRLWQCSSVFTWDTGILLGCTRLFVWSKLSRLLFEANAVYFKMLNLVKQSKSCIDLS